MLHPVCQYSTVFGKVTISLLTNNSRRCFLWHLWFRNQIGHHSCFSNLSQLSSWDGIDSPRLLLGHDMARAAPAHGGGSHAAHRTARQRPPRPHRMALGRPHRHGRLGPRRHGASGQPPLRDGAPCLLHYFCSPWLTGGWKCCC